MNNETANAIIYSGLDAHAPVWVTLKDIPKGIRLFPKKDVLEVNVHLPIIINTLIATQDFQKGDLITLEETT